MLPIVFVVALIIIAIYAFYEKTGDVTPNDQGVITAVCLKCKREMNASEESAGEVTPCLYCRKLIQVPRVEDEVRLKEPNAVIKTMVFVVVLTVVFFTVGGLIGLFIADLALTLRKNGASGDAVVYTRGGLGALALITVIVASHYLSKYIFRRCSKPACVRGLKDGVVAGSSTDQRSQGVIDVECPACKTVMEAPDDMVGLTASCAGCGEIIEIKQVESGCLVDPEKTPGEQAPVPEVDLQKKVSRSFSMGFGKKKPKTKEALRELKEIYDEGLIDEAGFEAKKQELLGKL